MRDVLRSSYSQEFAKQCRTHSFICRGKAFFRVIGDGVLQVLKFEYERAGAHYALNVGLFSMYGEMSKQWFTSSGCIPRYSIMNLVGWKDTFRPDLFNEQGECIHPPNQWGATPEEQLDVLVSKGFTFLDQIVTQQHLSEILIALDKVKYNGTVIWNDSLKLAPFLCAGDLENALKVVDTTLNQHEIALQSYKAHFSPEKFKIRQAEQRELDRDLYALREIIVSGDKDIIRAYLNQNYQVNLGYAKRIGIYFGKTGDGLREPF